MRKIITEDELDEMAEIEDREFEAWDAERNANETQTTRESIFVHSRLFSKLESLTIHETMNEASLDKFLSAPYPSLKALDLRVDWAVTRSFHSQDDLFPSLEELRIDGYGAGDANWNLIFPWSKIYEVKRLELSQCNGRADEIERLFDGIPANCRWKELSLPHNPFDQLRLEKLTAKTSALRELELLSLETGGVSVSYRAKEQSRFDSLKLLNLTGCQMQTNELESLFETVEFPALKVLNLCSAILGPCDLLKLVSHPWFPNLFCLNLLSCDLADTTNEALLEFSKRNQLRIVNLSFSNLDPASVLYLAREGAFRNVWHLGIAGLGLSREAFDEVVCAEHAPALQSITVPSPISDFSDIPELTKLLAKHHVRLSDALA